MSERKRSQKRSAGEGSIYYDEANKVWVGSVELEPVNGRRRRKKVHGKTRKEVAEKIKQLQAQQAQGLDIAPARVKVGVFLDTWLEEVVKSANKPRTYRSYQDMVRLHISPVIGHHELAKLTPAHVQAMLNALLVKRLSPRSVAYARAVLRRALNVAMRWYGLARNVAALVEPPRSYRHQITPLAVEQARALLAAVKEHRLAALYHLALTLGLRRGELLALRVEDVDLEAGTLTITGTLQWIDGELVRGTPKTAGSTRVVPLPPDVVRVLRAHLQRLEEERQREGWSEHGYLFPSVRGTPINPYNLLRHFKNALEVAGLPETTRFHDLRHSCATLLVAQGVHPRVIMEILGHSSINVTMNTYSHVVPEAQRAAAAQLAGLFAPPTEASEGATNERGSTAGSTKQETPGEEGETRDRMV